SSRRRHTRFSRDWSSDVCSSDLLEAANALLDGSLRRLSKTQQELMESTRLVALASRQAGMAEIATGILHNVGNVLNSIGVCGERSEERRVGKEGSQR